MIIEPFLPMLAVRSEPFDSGEFVFEVKWNGVRALAARDASGGRLWGRELADYRNRYPELAFLDRLPPGTVLDGEIVLLRQGVPDLEALLARHPLTQATAIQHLSRTDPVRYVVFDALYADGRCLFAEPLYKRRAALRDVFIDLAEPQLVFSDGIAGPGSVFFEQVVAQGHEGVVAKHLASTYAPGRRCAAWRKIKPARTLPCVIVGYLPGRQGFHRLQVAAPREGQLCYVAGLHNGFTDTVRAQLSDLLLKRRRPQPVVPCPAGTVGVEPDLHCQVRFLEWTHTGRLRGASFQRLLDTATTGAAVPASALDLPCPDRNRRPVLSPKINDADD
jgi:bifunctional non-homologous end joining protein LigD